MYELHICNHVRKYNLLLKVCKISKLNKFKMNPYDTCVANQLVNGLHKSILFHVDYCKLIHKDTKVNASCIGVLHEEYHSIFEDGSGTMKLNHGKLQKYLGMTLDYTTVGQVKTTILDYIGEVLYDFDKAEPTGDGTKSSNSQAIF